MVAGILTRAADILKSNVHALLDKAEDPAKMIDQLLREARSNLAQVKQESALVIAQETATHRALMKERTLLDLHKRPRLRLEQVMKVTL